MEAIPHNLTDQPQSQTPLNLAKIAEASQEKLNSGEIIKLYHEEDQNLMQNTFGKKVLIVDDDSSSDSDSINDDDLYDQPMASTPLVL